MWNIQVLRALCPKSAARHGHATGREHRMIGNTQAFRPGVEIIMEDDCEMNGLKGVEA